MKIKVQLGIEEIDLLVSNEEEKDLIVESIILYPVTWDIVKDMILRGLSGKQIKELCSIWYEKGYPIESAWNCTSSILMFIQ